MAEQGGAGEPKTDAERRRAFNKARAEELRRQIRLIADADREIARLLEAAAVQIAAALAAAPSDFQAWRLMQLEAEVARVMGDFQAAAAAAAGDGVAKSWAAGAALVDAPLAAAGVAWRPVMLDRGVLDAMRAFTTAKINGAAADIVNKVNGELAAVLLGTQSPHEAMTKVKEIVGAAERRATTIVRTELGRAYSAAGQARMVQAASQVKGLMKQWRRSGKRLARHEHEAIDGQIRAVDEPFQLGAVKLMFPRDPKGPLKHTINCGCMSLPYMKDWEVVHPKEQPFSQKELNVSNTRRLLEDSRHAEFEDRARALWSGKAHADGSFLTTGRLDDDVLAALKERGFSPATREIAIADRILLHAARDAKKRRGAALPEKIMANLPGLMERPAAILLDKTAAEPTLIYVLHGPPDANRRLPRVAVKIRDVDTRQKHHAHNWIVTAGYEDAPTLRSEKRFLAIRPLES